MVSVQAEPAGDGWRCAVSVRSQDAQTEHQVSVSEADVRRWARGADRGDVEDLVRRSFEFLLEREPPSSILRDFDLAVIQRYFPEYDALIRR
jgi:hypothetical protein